MRRPLGQGQKPYNKTALISRQQASKKLFLKVIKKKAVTVNRAFSTYLFFRLTQFQTHAALSPFQWLACTFLKYPTVPLHPSLNLPQLSLAADDATLITELLPPLPSSPPAPASHNELFSHSGWTGQKWQESCEEWDGKRKKEREREGDHEEEEEKMAEIEGYKRREN